MNLDFHEFWLALTTQFWIREQPWLMDSGLLVFRAAISAWQAESVTVDGRVRCELAPRALTAPGALPNMALFPDWPT